MCNWVYSYVMYNNKDLNQLKFDTGDDNSPNLYSSCIIIEYV